MKHISFTKEQEAELMAFAFTNDYFSNVLSATKIAPDKYKVANDLEEVIYTTEMLASEFETLPEQVQLTIYEDFVKGE